MSLLINDPTSLVLRGSFNGVSFELEMSDRAIVTAMEGYDQPEKGVRSLLNLGAHALQAVSTGLSVETVRREFEQMAEQLQEDVKAFRQHVNDTLTDNGPVAKIFEQALAEVQSAVQDVIRNQASAEVPGSLVARIQASAKSVDQALEDARGQIRKSVREELDQHSEKVNRLVLDMRDLDPNSALGGALTRIEQAIGQLSTTIAASEAAERASSQERERGTIKGRDYEEMVMDAVAEIAAVHGDVPEHTGNQPGQVTSARRQSKEGDITCTVAEDRRIVFEAKDRDAAALSLDTLRSELDEAMRNRGAQAAVAVVSNPEVKFTRGQPLITVGPTMWAVVYDKETPNPLALRVAYLLAKQVATAITDESDSINFDALRQGVEAINGKLKVLDAMKVNLDNIAKSHGQAVLLLEQFRRDVGLSVTQLFEILSEDQSASTAA